jgi:hypothetical protein
MTVDNSLPSRRGSVARPCHLFTLVVIMAAMLAALYFLLTAFGVASLHFGAYYGLMSLVTIAAYSIDKNGRRSSCTVSRKNDCTCSNSSAAGREPCWHKFFIAINCRSSPTRPCSGPSSPATSAWDFMPIATRSKSPGSPVGHRDRRNTRRKGPQGGKALSTRGPGRSLAARQSRRSALAMPPHLRGWAARPGKHRRAQ